MQVLVSEHVVDLLQAQGESRADIGQALAAFDLAQPVQPHPLAAGDFLVALTWSAETDRGGWFALASAGHGPDQYEVIVPFEALAGTPASTLPTGQQLGGSAMGLTIYVPGPHAGKLRPVPPVEQA